MLVPLSEAIVLCSFMFKRSHERVVDIQLPLRKICFKYVEETPVLAAFVYLCVSVFVFFHPRISDMPVSDMSVG